MSVNHSNPRKIYRLVKVWGLFGLWLAVTIFIVNNYQTEQQTLTPRAGPPYPDNLSSLSTVIAALVAEIIVLYALLRPWSYQRSFGRPLLALMIFSVWMLISMAPAMHGGSSFFLHVVWLFLLNLILAACALVSGIAAAIRQRENKML